MVNNPLLYKAGCFFGGGIAGGGTLEFPCLEKLELENLRKGPNFSVATLTGNPVDAWKSSVHLLLFTIPCEKCDVLHVNWCGICLHQLYVWCLQPMKKCLTGLVTFLIFLRTNPHGGDCIDSLCLIPPPHTWEIE